MLRYFLLLFYVFSSSSLILAMNLPLNQVQQNSLLWIKALRKPYVIDILSKGSPLDIPRNVIRLTCTDGIMDLPIKEAQKCKTFKHCLTDVTTNTPKDFGKIDFSIKEIGDLFNVMKKYNFEDYPFDNINKIFEVADYLEASQNIRHMLAMYLLNTNKNFDRKSRYKLLKNCYPLPDVIAELKKLGHPYTNYFIKHGYVDLSYANLQSLGVLYELFDDSDQNESIYAIDLRHNQLTSLDLADIISVFPNVKHILAQNNNIQSLTTDDLRAIKDGMTISLQHNNISTIEPYNRYNAPLKALINLKKNPISNQKLENLKQAFELSKYQTTIVPWMYLIVAMGGIVGCSMQAGLEFADGIDKQLDPHVIGDEKFLNLIKSIIRISGYSIAVHKLPRIIITLCQKYLQRLGKSIIITD